MKISKLIMAAELLNCGTLHKLPRLEHVTAFFGWRVLEVFLKSDRQTKVNDLAMWLHLHAKYVVLDSQIRKSREVHESRMLEYFELMH